MPDAETFFSAVGDAVPFPDEAIEKDFAWSEAHPVADAYRAHRPMPYDASTAAMAAVFYAVRSRTILFRLSSPGSISVLDDGRTKFTPSSSGKHRFLIADPAQTSAIQKTYIEIASAKPVPRAPRFRRPVQQEQAPPTPPQKKQ